MPEPTNVIELSAMQVHCLVKEKLKLKGICIKQNNSSLLQVLTDLKKNNFIYPFMSTKYTL